MLFSIIWIKFQVVWVIYWWRIIEVILTTFDTKFYLLREKLWIVSKPVRKGTKYAY